MKKTEQEIRDYMIRLRDKAAMGFITDGEAMAYQMWLNGRKEFECRRRPGVTLLTYELSTFLWDAQIHSFIETLREAGIRSFVFTNTSTAVMDNLHSFESEGCEIKGLASVTYNFINSRKKGIEIYILEKEK